MDYAVAGAFAFIPLLVYVVGLVLALVTRARHPRRSTFAVIGFVILIVEGLLGTAWSVLLPMQLQQHWPFELSASLSAVFSVVETLLLIAGWVLILFALFARERAASTQPPVAAQPPPFPGQRPPGYQ